MTHKGKDPRLMSIGETASSLGITRRMILNYEEKGLLQADIKDGATGNRYYTAEALTKIRTIRVLQNLGLSLSDIKAYCDGTLHLESVIAHLEKLRDELNLNIERLKERINTENNLAVQTFRLPAQTVYCRTLQAATVEERKEHLCDIIPDAMRQYTSDTSRRMYFIEYPLEDTSLISYCIAVSPKSQGENIRVLPEETALGLYYHGSYESIPKVREQLLKYARDNNLSLKGTCRHIYLEGPPAHQNPSSFITQVALLLA